jgi:di/tricarboxylate transporter
MEITIVLSLLLLAIILFATEKFSVDIVTLIMLIVLVLTNIITPAEAYAGFSSDFIVILASVFVLGAALEDTGVLEFMISKLVRVASKSTNLLLALVMLVAGAISAFMNNTTVTAMFVTPLVGVSKKARISSSKILMPLSYASILGGTCTLIGTSTNVAVSGYLDKAGIEPVGLFEITPIGLILFAVGIIYMMTIGKKLLPKQTNQQGLVEEYNIKKYLTEILVMPESPLIGQNVFTSALANAPFRTLNLIRGKNNFLPDYHTVFQADDILLVEGSLEDLIKIKEAKGIEIMADVMAEKDLETKDIRLAELLVTVKSNIIGRTVREIDFTRRYGFAILAIGRHGETLRSKINEVELRMGDLLLVQGSADRLTSLRSSQNLTILDEFQPILFKKQKGLITISCFLLAILLGSLELVPLSVSFLGAAVISVLTKCITTERAYQIIDWRLLILIGGMTAFGTAMENSGAASYLATGIVNLLQDWGTIGILAGFVVLTVFLTQPMSNAAAALVIVPVAIKTALALQVDPRSFAIAIMLSASISLITPFEPSCILVYGPGKYKFSDFLKVGSGLTLILVALILGLVPFFWPF